MCVKFYQKTHVLVSLSNGLILKIEMETQQVDSVISNKCAIIDQLKMYSPNFLLTAGIDSKIRLWNVESVKMVAKFEIHKFAT